MSNHSESGDLAKLSVIAAPPGTPAADPDALTMREQMGLKGTQTTRHYQLQLIKTLQDQIKDLKSERTELHDSVRHYSECKVNLARFETTDRVCTLFFLVCTPAILAGTLMIDKTDNWQSMGWGIVIVGGAVQMLMGLFNPQSIR